MTQYQNSDFRITSQTTTPTTYTSSVTRFGEHVAITPEYAFVSFLQNGVPEIGRYQANLNWTYQGSLVPPAGFNPATTGTLAASAGVLAVGSGASQTVNLHFVTAGGVTTAPVVIATPVPAAAQAFGSALAVEGDLVAVGAPLLGGAVYLFRKAPTAFTWTLEATLGANQAGDTNFGRSVAIANGFVTVAATTTAAGQTATGVVFTFRKQGSGWVRAARLVPDAAGTPTAAQFGSALAAANDDLVIGAPGVLTSAAGQPPVATGAVYFATVGVTPTAVAASDGRYPARIQVRWNDESASEDGFRIYRRGPTDPDLALVGTVGPDQEVFDDFEVAPGDAYTYCVASYLGTDETNTNPLGESGRICDAGFTPANGTISGRLATGVGAGVIGSSVCLAPGPDQAVNLDGLGGRAAVLEFGAMPALFTAEAWFNADTAEGGGRTILSAAGPAPASGLRDDVGVVLLPGTASGTQRVLARHFATQVPSGSNNATVFSPDLAPGWHHVAVTQTAAEFALYVDGAFVGAQPHGGTSLAPRPFYIGGDPGFPDTSFDGRIDDVRLWSRARTAAEIAAEVADPRPLQGNETGLYAYWAVDQGRGRILTDITANGHHATLQGGAEWTREAAPINTCATSDVNGNYAFNGLRYGTSTAFNVTPTDSTRQFTPAVRAATLTPASPTQNQVDFTDTSAYTVRGSVAHSFGTARRPDGTPFWPGQADVPAPGVDISVDGVVAGTSAADGTFAVSVQGARAHTFTASAAGHVFTAALAAQAFPDGRATVTTLGDVSGLRFTNVRQDTLRGQAGGGCGRTVGSLTFRIYTEDRRFERTVTTDGSRPYTLPLPPLAYRLEYVEIANVQPPLVRTNVVQYYRNLGPLSADLTAGADTVDFRYRAPIALAVTGLGDPPVTCAGGYRVVDAAGVERQLLPNVPVIAEYARPQLTVSAFEDYGNGGRCPVDAGTVRIFDGFADATNTPVEVALTNGSAQYRTFGRSPDTFSGRTVSGVDRSYQKSLTAVLEVPDGPTVTETVWAFVEGYREKPATFVTATMSEIPILILRDPPGTESSAYVEQGTSSCVALSQLNTTSVGGGAYVDIKLGLKSTIGLFLSTDTGAGFNFQATTRLGGGVAQTYGPPESNMQICATTTERWETSGDTGWSGEDLYAGVGLNFIFAEADQLDAETTGGSCRIRLSTVNAADFNAPDPFETVFAYGTTHIEQTLIPLIERRIRLLGTPTGTGTPSGPAPEAVLLAQSLDNWRGMIAYDSTLTAAALAGEVQNRSFSGGTSYAFGVTADTTFSRAYTSRAYFSTETRFGAIFTAGYDNLVGGIVEASTESTFGRSAEEGTSFGTGYTLADGDAGDYFTVDVARDSTYGTYVFNTLSGASSNPWEPNTQKRDNPRLAIDPPVRNGVPEGQQALFTLSLTNASESNERREYILDAPPHLNPSGASIRYQGDYLNERRVLVEPGQTISFPITVEPGPEETDYDLAIIAYSPFDHEIWRTAPQLGLVTSDTTRFSVSFRPRNAPVNLVEPEDGWAVTLARDTLQLSLDGLAIQNTARERIGVELRRASEAWEDAISLRGDQIAVGATSIDSVWTPRAALADGVYEMRAFARRTEPDGTAAPTYAGPVATGRIDRTAPRIFGLPQPADLVLALGETVGVTFDEPVDCPRLRRDLLDGGAAAQIGPGEAPGPVLSVNCAERTVLIAPQDASAWSTLEGQLVTARLRGVRDLAGNPMAPVAGTPWEATWRFTVRRNAFGWTPAIVAVNAQPNVPTDLPAALVNGRAQPVTFDLVPHNATGLPFTFAPVDASGAPTGGPGIRVTTSALAGTVVSGNVLPVAFRWPGAPEGRYRATVNVHSVEAGEDLGVAPLDVTVVVACQAPAWAVNAAAFETHMTITADLHMAGVTSDDPADRLAAFVGGEVRGVASPAPLTAGGATVWRVPLVVYGTGAREQVTFQAWDQSACTLHRTTSQVVEFTTDGVLGSAQSPLVIEAPGAGGAPLAVPLAQGWTWVSTNREGTNTFATALVGVGSAETDLVQASDGFAQYTPGAGWVGSIAGLAPGRGYHIRLAAPATMTHPGAPVNAATPIGILAGWNWIGYLPTAPLAVNAALASLTPATDDEIKSQTQYAQYVAGVGWMGSLATMRAGAGYQLRAAEDGTLTYPAGTPRPGIGVLPPFAERPVRRFDTLPVQAEPGLAVMMPLPTAPDDLVAETTTTRTTRHAITTRITGRAAETAFDDGPEGSGTASRVVTDENPFEHSMTVTASLAGAADGVHVAVYAVTPDGDELRAVAPVQHIDALNGTRAFLLVPGAARDSLVLRAVTANDAGGWTPAGTLSVVGRAGAAAFGFVRDGTAGTASLPLALSLAGATAGEGDPLPAVLALSRVRPNPFSTSATVEYALPAAARVHLSMYDVLGREVAVFADGERPAGVHALRLDARQLASGTYIVRLVAGAEVRIQRVTVTR